MIKDKKLTPLKAIRAKCMDCTVGQYKEIRLCTVKDCSLYNYRFGHNPSLKGKRGRDIEAMKKMRSMIKKKKTK